MALKIFSFLFFIYFNLAFAGNGSSGVGTASIAKGFSANNFMGKIERVGDAVIDLDSKEKIFEVETVEKDDIDFKKLAKSKFGQVQGFEYVPYSIKEKNYWVLCNNSEKACFKLIPTSSTNKKIPSILGSLIEEKE